MLAVGKHTLQISSPVRARFLQILCFLVVLLSARSLYAIDHDSIRRSLFALDSARQTAIHELEETALSASEVTDYRDFIVYLNTRIVTYCMELAEEGGWAALEGLPCPTKTDMSGVEATAVGSGGAVFYTTGSDQTSAQTRAEKSEELEDGFLTTLGEFDEMLLKEDDKIASRVPSQREPADADASGRSGSVGVGDEAGEPVEGSEGDAVAGGLEDQPGADSGTQSSVGTGSAEVDHSVYGAPGGQLPPPEDDDIVARQLREAAEKETDPELKEKLWEEYWKYKGVSK